MGVKIKFVPHAFSGSVVTSAGEVVVVDNEAEVSSEQAAALVGTGLWVKANSTAGLPKVNDQITDAVTAAPSKKKQ
jgi:hypothetical protein